MRVALAIALLALGDSPATGAKSHGVSVQPKGKAKVTNSYVNMFGYKATKSKSKSKGKKVRQFSHSRFDRVCDPNALGHGQSCLAVDVKPARLPARPPRLRLLSVPLSGCVPSHLRRLLFVPPGHGEKVQELPLLQSDRPARSARPTTRPFQPDPPAADANLHHPGR